MLKRRRVKATVSSNLTPSANYTNITSEMLVGSNAIYKSVRTSSNWIIMNPALVKQISRDDLKPLKDLIDKTQSYSRFKIRRGGRVRFIAPVLKTGGP